MTPQAKLAAMNKIFSKALDIAEAKSHDYAGTEDAMANFRLFGWKGIVVRLSDKMIRVTNFVKNQTHKVADESLEDNLIDIINYAALTLIMKQEEDAEKQHGPVPCGAEASPPSKDQRLEEITKRIAVFLGEAKFAELNKYRKRDEPKPFTVDSFYIKGFPRLFPENDCD